jgi:hypothetical protein
VLDEMMHGMISSYELANKLHVSVGTIDRDKRWINNYLSKSFQELSNAYPSIHQSMMLAHFDILATAWNIINDNGNDSHVRIAASYMAMSAMDKIISLSGSGNKILEAYTKIQAEQKRPSSSLNTMESWS